MPYSFAGNTALYILSQTPVLIPGIARATAVYYDHNSGQIKGGCMNEPRLGDIPESMLLPDETMEDIRSMRKKSTSCRWQSENDIPFHPKKDGITEIGMFRELGMNALIIPIENEYDGQKDLLFYYFSKDFSLFRISRSDKPFSADHKSIIELLLSNYTACLARQFSSDRQVLREINQAAQTLLEKNKSLREENRRLGAMQNRNVTEICRHFLNSITRRTGTHYTLTQAAASKLRQFAGDMEVLQTLLERAAGFVSTIHFEHSGNEACIDENIIEACSVVSTALPPEPGMAASSPRMQKAAGLLDTLEDAAQKVISNSEEMTGANVGRACNKPRSHAAITFSLNTHKPRIQALMEQYPDKWKLIRQDFKPLLNVLDGRNSA